MLSSSRKASSSWEPRNDTKSQRTTDFTQGVYWEEKARVVVASARERSIREQSRRQGLYSVSWGQSFSGWPGIEGIVWPDLEANSGIGYGFFSLGWGLTLSSFRGLWEIWVPGLAVEAFQGQSVSGCWSPSELAPGCWSYSGVAKATPVTQVSMNSQHSHLFLFTIDK